MGKAVRAIIIENGKILVMYRSKYGSEYFTLAGGRVQEHETLEQALVRETKEETGLTVTAARLVYYEQHPAPHNEQYIYLCHVAPHREIALQPGSEEGDMNRYAMNIHQPQWAGLQSFAKLQFRTPQLQNALIKAFKKGFPKEPEKL